MKVLQITAHFKPNIGGVETHLDDLIKTLIKKRWEVFVLTYRPLTTNVKWNIFEQHPFIFILRIPWIPSLFYKLITFPLLEFLYLLPGLFLATPFVLLIKKPEAIHAHGLVSGFTAVFWGKIFGIRSIVSTHSIYSFPRKGLYRNFVSWIFQNANYCLGLSNQAVEEILSLGINKDRVKKFTYWIDLEKFKRIENARSKLKWGDRFIVLFVGRLVREKGLEELLQSAKSWNQNIKLVIAGVGPLEDIIKKTSLKYKNIEYLGIVNQNELPLYYSGTDCLIVPSTSKEGFGRVSLEALACGTPVIGSNRGAISEAITSKVGELIDITPDNIKRKIEYYYSHRASLRKLANNCRIFAERRYSEKNAETIIRAYQS